MTEQKEAVDTNSQGCDCFYKLRWEKMMVEIQAIGTSENITDLFIITNQMVI